MQVALQTTIFEKLQMEYQEAGIPSVIVQPTDAHPYLTLIMLFQEVGNKKIDIRLESNFVPISNETDDVMLLQSFSTLIEQVKPYHQPELLRLIAAINLTLPLGAFGFIESTNAVYFKSNSILLRANELQQCVKQADVQNGMILSVYQLFIDAMIEVASGRRTADDALADIRYDRLVT